MTNFTLISKTWAISIFSKINKMKITVVLLSRWMNTYTNTKWTGAHHKFCQNFSNTNQWYLGKSRQRKCNVSYSFSLLYLVQIFVSFRQFMICIGYWVIFGLYWPFWDIIGHSDHFELILAISGHFELILVISSLSDCAVLGHLSHHFFSTFFNKIYNFPLFSAGRFVFHLYSLLMKRREEGMCCWRHAPVRAWACWL